MPDPCVLQPCDRCRQPTPAALLLADRTAFLRAPYHLCINCNDDRSRRTEGHLLLAFLLPIPLFLFVLCFFGNSPLLMLLDLLAAVSVFCLTVVPLHEAAHALVALVLRHKVPEISIGGDLPIYTLRVGSTRIHFAGWGGRGYCAHYAFPTPSTARSDALISAAGPASHLFFALVVFLVLAGLFIFFPDAGGLIIAPLCLFLGGHLAYFGYSVVPRYRRGIPLNDGALFQWRRRLARQRPGHAAARHAAAAIAWAIHNKDLPGARHLLTLATLGSAAKPALANPDDPSLHYQHARILAFEGQWTALQALLLPLLASFPEDIRPAADELLLLASLHLGSPPAAIAPLQSRHYYLGPTLNALHLFHLNRTDEALAALGRARGFSRTFETFCFTHATLAALHERLNCPAQAARYRARIHNLGAAPAVPPIPLPLPAAPAATPAR